MPTANHRRVVVITGASAGVGRATVREFARRKTAIGLIARGEAGLEATAREVRELGGEALVLPCDVADAKAVEESAERVEREFGPIDVWINDAMVSVFSPFLEMMPDEFHRVTEVTYLGQVYGTFAALKRMVPRDRGVVIQVGSALAYRGIPLQSAYCGAKHAIQGFTESVRTELMHRGSKVRLTMVQLPAVNTPQFAWTKSRMPRQAQPVPPIFQPEVPARAIYWASNHRRRELYVGGSTTEVIIGNKMLPGLGDLYLSKTGFDSQMTDEPEDPNRPNNLFKPVDKDFGAHGRFDDRAHKRSIQLWLTTHRRQLAAVGIAGLAVAAVRGVADLFKRREARSCSLPSDSHRANGR